MLANTSHRTNGFTLIELIVVVGIMVMMMALVVPAFKGIQGAGDLTKAAYDIQGTLDQARAYAMANNTFVFVGITEVDVTQSASASPQTSGIGRVAIAAVASRDGTRGYDVTQDPIASPAIVPANLVMLGKLQHFENIHLAASGVLNGIGVPTNADGTVGSGGMKRPGITSPNYVLAGGNAASTTSVTPFSWPLLGTAQYQFQTVINFDPQGVARAQYATNQDKIGQYLEIGLQQTHGNVIATGSSGANSAAIQIDGMTGSTRIYRP